MSALHKYIILFGKHSRWETVDGVEQVVTRVPGEIVEMTIQQAEQKQDSFRLATPEEVDAYERKLRGEEPPIQAEHVGSSGAPPMPTPAHDDKQPPATPDNPPARIFAGPGVHLPKADTPAPSAPTAQGVQSVGGPGPSPLVPPGTTVAPAPSVPATTVKPKTKAAPTEGKPKAKAKTKGKTK